MKILFFVLLLQLQLVQAEVWFIVNPKAGSESKQNIEKLIEKYIEGDYKVLYTDGPKNATELAKKAVEQGVDVVAVVGGDGTVHEAANGLIGSKTSLAIIPCGSGNGLARHLGIPLDTEKAINLINHSIATLIDTIKINEEFYLNVAGVGFDAHIGEIFSHDKKRGFLSYIGHVLKEFPKYEPQEYELVVDGKTINRKAFLISFANSSQWGNNASIAPEAEIDDGLIDIAILKEFPAFSSPFIALQLFTKSLHNSKYLEVIKGKEVILKKGGPAHVDGEPVTFAEQTKMEMNPSSLRVLRGL